ARADRDAIYNGLRGRTEDFLDLNSEGSFSGKNIVYKPSAFLYTNLTKTVARTYDGVKTWDAGNYVARVFATPTSIGGPWRISIFVCRSIGRGPTSDLWADAVKPTAGKPPPPGPGTYVVEKWRYGALGYLVDYVKDKIGYFAVGSNSLNDVTIASTSTNIQCVPDTVAVFHTMLGE
ncbi:MAG TPA: hypothetical protein VMY69_05625, partial [Phycisphaerae bacterium]|nr:hypothetical protein [Phycisphaerae bacterium]